MVYLFSVILIFFSLVKRDSKPMFFLLIIWMWILYAFNYDNADYSTYMNIYYGYTKGSSELFFSFLCDIGRQIGVSYEFFRGIYGFICLFLIGKVIYKSSRNKSLVLAFYFLFPYILDVVQIRHFMAIALITYAIPFLYKDDKKSLLKYIGLNILAIGFHYISAFYLILILVKKFSVKKIALISIILNIIMFILIRTNLLITILSNFLPENKIYIYFISDKLKSSSFLVMQCFIVQFLIFISIYICYYIYKKHNSLNIENDKIKEQINIYQNTLKINLLLSILNPAYYYNFDLIRIVRGVSIINYIVIGNTIENKNIKDNIIPIGIGILLIVLLFYFMIIKVNIYGKTGYMIFEYNYLLDVLKLGG